MNIRVFFRFSNNCFDSSGKTLISDVYQLLEKTGPRRTTREIQCLAEHISCISKLRQLQMLDDNVDDDKTGAYLIWLVRGRVGRRRSGNLPGVFVL